MGNINGLYIGVILPFFQNMHIGRLYIYAILNAVLKYLLSMDTADCSLQQLPDRPLTIFYHVKEFQIDLQRLIFHLIFAAYRFDDRKPDSPFLKIQFARFPFRLPAAQDDR